MVENKKKWSPTAFAEIKGASSGIQSNEWWTPPEIFEALDIDFDLDPASAIGGVEWLPTKSYFTKEDDGLKQKWFGRVWLNSPYGKQTGLWLEKFINHGNGIALVFSRTDTKWFHDYAVKGDAILFTKGRIKFYSPDINKQNYGTASGSLFVACGKSCVEALKNSGLGYFIDLRGTNEA
jgi:hypothetical protein